LSTAIERNQNRILKFLYDIEEKRGEHVSVPPEAVCSGTELNPVQINDAVKLLEEEDFVGVVSGGRNFRYRFQSLWIMPKGKLRVEKINGACTVTHQSKNPRNVFVVHGRDLKARDAMFEFLRSLDLHPLEWTELVASTRKGAPYIGEVVYKAFSEAQAVVVLMTPDDQGCVRKPFIAKNDPIYETELTPQARLNVIFEAGIAMGRCEERTIIVEIGSIRPFSDIGGRHTIRLDNSAEKRRDLAKRLDSAGCQTNLGGTDWLKAGNFSTETVLRD
jgi:predicted nucleotide-binding protein